MKLLEEQLIETKNKKEIERQILRASRSCLRPMSSRSNTGSLHANAGGRPNFISLYVTAFVVEDLINHRSIVDVYGTNEQIYGCVNNSDQADSHTRVSLSA